MTITQKDVKDAVELIGKELQRSNELWPKTVKAPFEAAMIIREEMEEFFRECNKKNNERDIDALCKELVQFGAMCAKTYENIGLASYYTWSQSMSKKQINLDNLSFDGDYDMYCAGFLQYNYDMIWQELKHAQLGSKSLGTLKVILSNAMETAILLLLGYKELRNREDSTL